jgi:hypothetical protein
LKSYEGIRSETEYSRNLDTNVRIDVNDAMIYEMDTVINPNRPVYLGRGINLDGEMSRDLDRETQNSSKFFHYGNIMGQTDLSYRAGSHHCRLLFGVARFELQPGHVVS